MRGCEGVNKVLFVVEVGHGQNKGVVDQHWTVGDANARTYRDEPISADFLGNGEVCRSAAGINPGAGEVIVNVHGAEIAFNAGDPMAALKVETNRAAAGE